MQVCARVCVLLCASKRAHVCVRCAEPQAVIAAVPEGARALSAISQASAPQLYCAPHTLD